MTGIKQKFLKSSAALLIAATPLLAVPSAQAQQVFATDVVIQGSLCVGFDCVSGESFGFDTLRLKENNLRIHFQDTSASASFPTNDWRIVANDTTNGGTNYLGIEDSTAGRMPFRVEAGAPANTLYAEADGDVGIKTANPVVDLHVVEGNTPTLRLEQDGSDGFTAQTWDVAGNEANFFIRDVTNGSQLAFRIEPGADESSIHIDSANNVGILTSDPTASLHVRRTNKTAKVKVEDTSTTAGSAVLLELINNGNPEIELNNTRNANIWKIGGGRRLVMSNNGGANLFTLENTGDLILTGSITTTGSTCGSGCDKVFEADYELPSIEEHAAEMWANGYLPNIGPTVENEPINVTDKVGRMLNELEKAHIYIDQLNEENKMATDRLDRLEAQMQ